MKQQSTGDALVQQTTIKTPVKAAHPIGFSEDWTAVIVGLSFLGGALLVAFAVRPQGVDWQAAEHQAALVRQQESQLSLKEEAAMDESHRAEQAKKRKKPILEKLGIAWSTQGIASVAKLQPWSQDPIDALRKREKTSPASVSAQSGSIQWTSLAATLLLLSMMGAAGAFLSRLPVLRFLLAFPALFLLAVLAYLMASQEVIKNYNFEYPLWGLLVGMLIGNTLGIPRWLAPVVRGELFVKIGLVLFGGEVLLSTILVLGIPGFIVAWMVTPVVLITTFWFGQRVLRIPSKSLNLVVSADMSVCGVSAAIATAAACKAKKEELSLAIGLSLTFTAVMMVAMPKLVQWMDLPARIGGAWMGGTIDSTGAVAAAGETLGVVGFETAVTVKMIQNILIGVVALGVALYWSRYVEPTQKVSGSDPEAQAVPVFQADNSPPRISSAEIWLRFPKFVVGFLAASLVCSGVSWASFFGESWVTVATQGMTVPIRGWMFCLAFVCIGLSTNFRQLAPYLRSGKPLVLYLCGQSLNLLLTLIMAYLMFGAFYDWLTS